MISLLDQPVRTHEYDCPLIMALAVLGAKLDGWKGVHEYPSLLSSILKTSRFLVLLRVYISRPSTYDIGQEYTSVEDIQGMVTRFLSSESYTPFKWIYDLRSFGITLAMTTTSEGRLS